MSEPRLSRWSPAFLLATWGGVGLLPRAPGTWGSLAALPVGWVIWWAAGPIGLLIASIAVFIAGIPACSRVAEDLGTEDPGRCVVDEVAGQWLTLALAFLLGAPSTLAIWALGFVMFRLFDILKPWPASWADRSVHGGLGVMLDDMIAGIYAGLATVAIQVLAAPKGTF